MSANNYDTFYSLRMIETTKNTYNIQYTVKKDDKLSKLNYNCRTEQLLLVYITSYFCVIL